MNYDITVICCCDTGRFTLMYHFFKYYYSIGIKNFLVLLDVSDESLLQSSIQLLDSYNVKYELWKQHNKFNSPSVQLPYLNKFIKKASTKWIASLDVDEFFELSKPLDFFLNSDYKLIQGQMIDRFAVNGLLKKMTIDEPLDKQYPVKRKFSKQSIHACTIKPIIFRSKYQLENVHTINLQSTDLLEYQLSFDRVPENEIIFPELQKIYHYKWDYFVKERLEHLLELRHLTIKERKEVYKEAKKILNRISNRQINYV